MARKSAKMAYITAMMGETGLSIIENVGIEPLIALRSERELVEDTRFQPYVEHLLADIVR